MQVLRTKFKNEIIAEFVVPEILTNKVLIICGGMPSYPAKQKYQKFFDYFTKRGFFVFVPRYRGSWESKGKMFEQCPSKDIKDIVDELPSGFKNIWDKQTYKIKNPEVYLYGSSFGGPAVLLNSKDKRVKKAIASSPVLDWTTMDDTIEPIDTLNPFVQEAFGEGYRMAKNGWNKIKKGNFYNPVTALEKIDGKKCLIIHSKDDEIVSLTPVAPFCKKTQSTLVLVKSGGHGLDIFESRFKKRWVDFFGLSDKI